MFSSNINFLDYDENDYSNSSTKYELFDFDIIIESNFYKSKYKKSLENDLIRDVCTEIYSNISDNEINELQICDYIKVVQKSNTWLTLRALSCGTASNIGKYVFNKNVKFARFSDVVNAWIDKLNNEPFIKSHVVDGHMTWGVKHEDAALMYFANEFNIGVIQVGSIKVTLTEILKLSREIFGNDWVELSLNEDNKYILVSPDGICGKPETNGVYNKEYKEIIGMLEIKCISPFYHLETDNYLTLCENMEKRQWFNTKDIPYVYVIQQALQALSGVFYYNMDNNAKMWFVRWSPAGFSTFIFSFKDLIRLGCLVSNLYFFLYENIKENGKDITDIYPLQGKLKLLEEQIEKEYDNLLNNVTHKYTEIKDYPEFYEYYKDNSETFFYVDEKYVNS